MMLYIYYMDKHPKFRWRNVLPLNIVYVYTSVLCIKAMS